MAYKYCVVRASVDYELKENLTKYCKNNGYKITEFIAMAIKNELERRKKNDKD